MVVIPQCSKSQNLFPSSCPAFLRVVLLIWLIESLGGVWCIEQPSSSLVRWHPRMLELFRTFQVLWLQLIYQPSNFSSFWHSSLGLSSNQLKTLMKQVLTITIAQVYCSKWWMAAYGGKTPKRHLMYSNSKAIGQFDLGKLCFDYKNPEYEKHRTTKKKVTNKNGKRKVAFQGVKKKLKASQFLGLQLWCRLVGYLKHVQNELAPRISKVDMSTFFMRQQAAMIGHD